MNKVKKFLLFFIGILVAFGGLFFFKGVNTFSAISSNSDISSLLENDERWDVLILGHQPLGGLTDSIMVFSYEKSTGKAALFSIPRDLWVNIPEYGKQKINFAYVAGEEKNPNGGGLKMAKEVVSDLTGLDIDFVIASDVEALKEIVDILGGIDVKEDRSFFLDFYGNYVRIKPGINHLSGSQTLAYIGSRSTTGSDFGRMERQQKVLLAIKDKAFSLELLSRPDKIWNIFNAVEKHIETDIPFSQIQNLIQMISNLEIANIETVVFDTSNYLYSSYSSGGAYILLPKKGDFSEIQAKCQGIFDESLDGTETSSQK